MHIIIAGRWSQLEQGNPGRTWKPKSTTGTVATGKNTYINNNNAIDLSQPLNTIHLYTAVLDRGGSAPPKLRSHHTHLVVWVSWVWSSCDPCSNSIHDATSEASDSRDHLLSWFGSNNYTWCCSLDWTIVYKMHSIFYKHHFSSNKSASWTAFRVVRTIS
jgi:hypothetical protein